MMKFVVRHISIALLLLCATSCLIENNMSRPEKDALITAFEVEGQKSVEIDAVNHHIDVVIEETADITSLALNKIEFNEGVYVVGGIPDYLDLSETVTLVLMAYEEYTWTISATQPVDRYIKVENQVDNAEFHPEDRTAFVFVNEYQDLNAVTFLDMKLETEGSEVLSTTGISYVGGEAVEETLKCSFPMTLPCVMLRTFEVSYKGERIIWTVTVQVKKVGLKINSVNAFARHAEVKAAFDGSGTPVLEYRRKTESSWTTFTESVIADVGLSGDITGLEPDTDYLVMVNNEGRYSVEYEFHTEKEEQLYNMGFDEWYQAGKVWYPYAEGADPSVWDSANPGAATFIGSSTSPEETFVVEGKAARMESKWAVIAFAAGNIYTGKFGQIAGKGAELDWGVPFSSRPTSLKGYYSYSPQPIDRVGIAEHNDLLGASDKCQIQVILTDWEEPFRINTTKGQFVDIANDKSIIAYGKIESDKVTEGYEEFIIDLEYRDKTRKPAYVVISACASYLGDYFTGAVGSTLYIDEFEFVY